MANSRMIILKFLSCWAQRGKLHSYFYTLGYLKRPSYMITNTSRESDIF